MNYIYILNSKAKKKFNIDTMVVSGWFGYYSKFNEYWNGNTKIKMNLKDNDIDYIVQNSSYKEV